MKFKIVILLGVLSYCLDASQLIFPDGKIEKFELLKESRMTQSNSQSFLRHGQIYKDTREIYVSFGKEADLEKFSEKYNLTFIKITNSYYFTAVFDINSDQNVLTLCNTINQNENVRYAKPNWKRERVF
jgi:hypothetical protein